ncbi:major facilitator superfamily domain-containing protein [Phlyctochytrium arcticum]|nr:major facilitator superfamily domain-containing protein [Phlyctochytrium arcticum]
MSDLGGHRGTARTSSYSQLLPGRESSDESISGPYPVRNARRASQDSIDDAGDGESSLDDVISRIGFGKFHMALLVLCGFGNLADNMWMQGLALSLPHVQRHFDVPDTYIGVLSSAMFLGMFLGAVFWGTWSDKYGRKWAFNYTLIISTITGIAASFAPSFFVLCATIFLLGFGVGGHMPVDGCLFVEFCPREDRRYLTLLSVFFSIGGVVASVAALAIFSSSENAGGIFTAGGAWRAMVLLMGILSLLMLVGRTWFIKLKESPKFLLAQNDRQGLHDVLSHIIELNNCTYDISLDEVRRLPAETLAISQDVDIEDSDPIDSEPELSQNSALTQNRSTYRTMVMLCVHPSYRRTTLHLFAIWGLVNLGFTIFNAFIAKFMAEISAPAPENALPTQQSERDTYVACLLYAATAIPASLLATRLVDHPKFDRRGTLLYSTIATAASLVAVSFLPQQWGVAVTATCIVGAAATIMYAVLYTITPEIFPTPVRTTANGACSAIGRIASIIAPLISGPLFSISHRLPIYFAAVIIAGAALCINSLRLPRSQHT